MRVKGVKSIILKGILQLTNSLKSPVNTYIFNEVNEFEFQETKHYKSKTGEFSGENNFSSPTTIISLRKIQLWLQVRTD